MVQAIAVSQPPPKRKAIDGSDHWLAEIFNQIEHALREAA
jgi:hypothetical protein